MNVKTKAIVLNKIKYSETSVIVQIFTRAAGVQSFLVKGAFSKRNKATLALLENLSLVHISFDAHRDGLQYLQDISAYYTYSLVPFDMVRRSLFIFYNELIYKLLRDYQTDETLFDFMEQSLLQLDDDATQLTDVHIRFLLQLSQILGFYPTDNFTDYCCYFSLEESAFTHDYFEYPDFLSRAASCYLHQLMQQQAITTLPPKIVRQELLYALLRYFEKNNEQIHRIDSVHILADILS